MRERATTTKGKRKRSRSKKKVGSSLEGEPMGQEGKLSRCPNGKHTHREKFAADAGHLDAKN